MRLRPAAIRAMGRAHRAVYRLSGGRLLGRVAGMPVLMLTTTGRRTGRARTTPLTYFELGDEIAIVASNGGEDSPPRWWLNLQAEPRATIAIAGHSEQVTRQGSDRCGACPAVARDHRDVPRLRRLRAPHDPADPGRHPHSIHEPDQRKCTESVAPSSSSPTNRRLRVNCSGGLQPQVPRARCTGEDRGTDW